MNDIFLMTGGILCAAIGGDLFVRGVVSLARWGRISPGIISATFAAFATSSPELSVSIMSALDAKPQIALGDALGSNVVNIALILGLVLLIGPLQAPRKSLRRDFSVALMVPLLLAVLARDGLFSAMDALILLALFFVWLVTVVKEARRQRETAPTTTTETSIGKALLPTTAGLALLVFSGKLIVTGATGIAVSYGIDEFVIGATLVAVGTSSPELATALIAKLRGHDEVGIGTLLGSNIFNGLFIIATAALIHPIDVVWNEVVIGLSLGLLTTMAVFPTKSETLGRARGLLLLGSYAAYLALILG